MANLEEIHPDVAMVRTARRNLEHWTDKGYVPFTDASAFLPALKNLFVNATGNGATVDEYIVNVKDALVVSDYRNKTPCFANKRVLPGWMVLMAKKVSDPTCAQVMPYERFAQAFEAGLVGDTERLEAFLALLELGVDHARQL